MVNGEFLNREVYGRSRQGAYEIGSTSLESITVEGMTEGKQHISGKDDEHSTHMKL